MHILIANKHFVNDTGGSEIQSHIIAQKLSANNQKVSYINLGAETKALPHNRSYKLYNIRRNIFRLFKLINTLKPDVIYWRLNTNFSIFGLLMAKIFKIPIIFASSSLKDFNSKYLYSKFLYYFDFIIVNNKKFLRKVNHKRKAYIQNCEILGYEKFNFKNRYVLWVSNIKKRKNLELYLKLAKKYSHYNIHFLCAGSIQDRNYSWIKNFKKTPKNFIYLGKLSPQKINSAMKKSLFHITTENYDKVGFSNTFIQACSQKKPTLSFNFDPGGFINRYKTGKVSKGSEITFFKYFEDYYNNSKLRFKDGGNAYYLAKQEFNANNAIKKLMKIFKKLQL